MPTVPDVIPILWKVTFFLAAAAALGLVLRRRPASARHLLWSSALAGALALPLVSGALPRWTIPVWADLVPSQGLALFHVEVYDRASTAAQPRVAPAPPMVAPAGPAEPSASPSWISWAAALWLLGAISVSLQTLLGGVAVIRLRRQAAPGSEELASLTGELARTMGLRRRVQVLEARQATTPMTWGILHPVILLPKAVASGDAERLRAILLHELAHVVRRDFLVHLLAQAACAVYWFHPLVWLARREALRLRERASDDVVLGFGVRPSEYASSLVQLSRSLVAPRLCGSLGMCRPSSLETRVRAILDPGLRRGRMTLGGALATAVLASAVMIVVGAVHPALAEIPALGAPSFALAPQAVSSPDLAVLETQARGAEAAYDLDKASGLYRQAAEVMKERFGANSAQYAQALIRVGALYRAWDRLQEARPFYADAASILERNSGANDPDLAEPLYFLAMEAHLKPDLAQAEALYRRVLGLWKQPPGPETALAMQGLAVIAESRGDLRERSRHLTRRESGRWKTRRRR